MLSNENLSLGVVNEEGIEVNDNRELTDEEINEVAKSLGIGICNIKLNDDNLKDLKLDKTKFKEGLNDISKIAGQITGLCSTGMDIKDATDVILQLTINRETIEHNIKIQKITDRQTVY